MPCFDSHSIGFLKQLARNNRRDWFEAHRDEYQEHVRLPMADLVAEMDLRLAKVAPEMTGDPKRSIFRIHRDIRFSSDKSPYKTHAACWFFHRQASSKVGRESHGGGAGFYFHLEPGASFVGGGCWMPPRPALKKFRAAITDDPRAFEKIVTAPAVKRRFGALSPESMLKRMPRGYGDDAPGAAWLRYQSFTLGRPLKGADVTGNRLTTLLQSDFAALLPLVRWLNGVLGFPPRPAR